jgi:quercetin dioxygenase-like cupin family protein
VQPEIEPVPRWDWSPLPHEGSRGVVGRVLFNSKTRMPGPAPRPELFVSVLRFAADATTDEHADDLQVHEVICLEGSGFTSVGSETAAIRAGQRLTWPRGVRHRLWTAADEMTTLMVGRAPGEGE